VYNYYNHDDNTLHPVQLTPFAEQKEGKNGGESFSIRRRRRRRRRRK
jgi:hypothetical protein